MTQTTIALAGTPNSGKSSLFNALTGSRQKVGNYPGVTVERRSGSIKLKNGQSIEVVDLPGTYSLTPHSIDEEIAVKALTESFDGNELPQLVVAVADASNLERTLGLVLELRQGAIPVILALNMYDLASRRGVKIDLKAMARELRLEVVTTIAIERHGIDDLVSALERRLSGNKTHLESAPTEIDALDPVARFSEVDRILAVSVQSQKSADALTTKIDRIALHPIFGPVILAGLLLVMFQAVFSWAEAPMGWIEASVAAIGDFVGGALPEGWMRSLVVDGMIAGVGSVLVFLPQIAILFAFIFLLEGSGYMMRAAFILDRLMSKIGLRGRSFVPLLSSFACAIPGVMATRVIREPKDRLITILIAPLMTCSARLPVYVLLIGAFIPASQVFGFLELQGLVMFGLFLAGILTAMVVAWAMKNTIVQGPVSISLMELPTYKLPHIRNILMNVWQRVRAFIRRAGTLILGVSVSLWFLSSFPAPPEGATDAAINHSFAGQLGHAIEPLVRPLGFDWRIATGLIPGFAAREVMVGALGTVFAIENADDEGEGTQKLQDQIREVWPLSTGLALLAWYIFAPQCLATIAVVRRETNSWKWAAVLFTYTLLLAYIAAFCVRWLAELL
jgi:ferrous iron transport protein B